MSQSSLSGYFPSKKRRSTEDRHASVKRRKLSSTTSTTSLQPDSKTPASVSKGPGPSTASRTRRCKTNHVNGQRSLQDLFDVIAEADTPVPGQQTDKGSKITTPPPCDVVPSIQPSPCSDTITKLSTLKPPLTPQGAVLPSTPLKRPPTSRGAVLPSTPLKRPPTSRGAALVQLAQLKSPVKKSPVKKTSHIPHTSHTSHTRREMVAEMHRLSARELALPTREEKQRAHAIKERVPAIKEFRCLEIQSPTKQTDTR